MKMTSRSALILLPAALCAVFMACSGSGHRPLSLHPDNPHYFLYDRKPVVLAGSTEHYGAVLNLDFDYIPYLDELAFKGLNLTRTFSGIYCEQPGAFNITHNTLAPDSFRLICPWKRSGTPGYFNGGNKFDLTQWDEAYFERLRDFAAQAERRGVVVEMNLFCVFYEDAMWNLSPMNARNNINGIGEMPRGETLNLRHPGLTRVQEEVTRKIVTELNGFPNVYYEICNEPYFGVTAEWQRRISAVIAETEKALPNRHLISQNIANNSLAVTDPDPNVSLFNFHYAVPQAVELNFHLNKALGDNETGFAGVKDEPYRMEAWRFLLAGGALFNHLDYSFTASHEDGSFAFPDTQPGGGGPAIRSQIGFLRKFLEEFDLIRLRPAQSLVSRVIPEGVGFQAIADSGRAAAVYLFNPEGGDFNYALKWTGMLIPERSGRHMISTLSDDGIRVFLDDRKIIENWSDHAPAGDSAEVALTAGRPVKLCIEFYQNMGGAVARLSWSEPGREKTVIPAGRFLQPDGKPGLKVELFADREFRRLKRHSASHNLDFSGVLSEIFPVEEIDQPETARLALMLGKGDYSFDWISPATGETIRTETCGHAGGELTLDCPDFETDLALKVQWH
ncbi:hypothetical protein JW906_01940 [bacterium]|nr:hypothetical protein [bacterium]